MFFAFFVFSFSFQLRDTLIGEWDVFTAGSDFTQTSYTIEFHQSSYDSLDQNTINCTLWKDDSMHSYLPSAFIFNAQGPLAASLQIFFNSDYSGTIHNIKMRSFSHDSVSNSQLRTTFSFDEKAENGNNKISRFKIDKYIFVVDLSKFDKENKAIVEVSTSIDDKDSSLISSKNNYIVTRTREFESKQFLKQKQQSKSSKETIKEFSHETIDTKIVNKIKKILSDMEINIPNNYIIFIIAIFFMLIVFLISKIVTDCFIANETRKSTKTTGKKVKKHKKKSASLENKKDEVINKSDKENINNEKEKGTEKNDENDEEKNNKTKTD